MNGIEAVVLGTLMGTVGRIVLLRVDYRQYPSSPQGCCINIVIGALASALGAVAVQAFSTGDWVAVTFLATGAQHFRDIRSMERNSLLAMEAGEALKRGDAYVEDVAKRFESRNYICLITALVTCVAAKHWHIAGSVATGSIVLFGLRFVLRAKQVRQLADIQSVEGHFEGTLLKADGVILRNVALPLSRENIQRRMRFCKLVPRSRQACMTLANLGQRQAILFDTCLQLGITAEEEEIDYMPIAKWDGVSQCIYLGIMTEGKADELLRAVGNCQILESSRKRPRYLTQQNKRRKQRHE